MFIMTKYIVTYLMNLSLIIANIEDHDATVLRYECLCIFNLLNELGKSDKMRAFHHFFATSLINLIIQEHEC